VSRTHKPISVRETVNKHVASRGDTTLPRGGPILSVWVRNMNHLVKLAVCVARIEHINSFRSPVITLPHLRTHGIPSQCDPRGLNHVPVIEQLEGSFFLDHRYEVYARRRLGSGLRRRCARKQHQYQNGRHPDMHAGIIVAAIPPRIPAEGRLAEGF